MSTSGFSASNPQTGGIVAFETYTLPDGNTVIAHVPVDPTGTPIGGTDATGVIAPTGAAGIRGWLSGIYKLLTGTLTVGGTVVLGAGPNSIGSVNVSNLNAGMALDGTDATGVTAPTGAVGIRGWLSGIYSKVAGTLTVGGTVALGAGTAAIGTVGVTALPALPAGTNSIGTVALGAGTAAIGTVGVTALPALPAGTNSIGTVALGAGTAAVGTVGVTALPALVAGTATIGAVLPHKGVSSALGLAAASSTVIKATPGRVARVNVTTAGTAPGTINDVATTAGAAAANLVFSIPNTVGSYDVDFPMLTGIVAVMGAGQVASVSYE